MTLQERLESVLSKRQSIAKYRRLVVNPPNTIDFSSNDFLGLSCNDALRHRFLEALQSADRILGSTSSRLLDGNSSLAEELECDIARFHRAETALLFNSGFDANVGLFSTVLQPGDVILYDELIHASVHEGMRSSRAAVRMPFTHSNVTDLEQKLDDIRATRPNSNVFVAVESVYSMDGDVAPLREIVSLLRRHWSNGKNGYLIVDEAHATGVYGDRGRGVVSQLGLENDVFARLHTFSKALASNGAVVLGSTTLRHYLINYARPLIYSTFMPYSTLLLTRCAYQLLQSGDIEEHRRFLSCLIRHFHEKIRLPPGRGKLLPSSSPIQGIVLNGNGPVRALAGYLNERGFIVKPICSPTVPKGQERVRICLHSNNTITQVDALVQSVHDYFHTLETKTKSKL